MTHRSRSRDKETQRQRALIAVREARIKRDRRRGILVSAVVLFVASAAVAVVMHTSRPTSSAQASQALTSSTGMPGMNMGPTPAPGSGDMPGMNMDPGAGYSDVPGTSPTPTPDHAAGDMPGMDMPGMDSGSGDAHGTSPGHANAGEAAAARPLAPVLGTFGGGTSAVMLAAGFLRRRDRTRGQAKEASRAARRTQK
jgi:hypothetical protein